MAYFVCASSSSKVFAINRQINLLGLVTLADNDVIKAENLYNFDGKAGFTLSQGE